MFIDLKLENIPPDVNYYENIGKLFPLSSSSLEKEVIVKTGLWYGHVIAIMDRAKPRGWQLKREDCAKQILVFERIEEDMSYECRNS